jgi:amidase
MLPVADGSDMGGSLRNPAAFNDVYGFRPSQGRVPAGPSPEAFVAQMGVEGPMARSVRDMALLLTVQAGHDPRAPLSLDGRPDFAADLAPRAAGVRIAWLGDLGGHVAMEDGILRLCEDALKRLEGAGAIVEPHVPAFDMEALWQAFVTLRHFTSGSALKPHYDDPETRALLKPEAIFEVEGGLGLVAAEIFAASQVRTAWHRHLVALFERYDALAIPTAQVFPFPVERHWPREIAGRRMDSYHRWMEVSALATMAGCPAASVPVGFDGEGRAMGMQLIGPPRADQAVLDLAAGYEQVTPYGVR